MSVAGTNDRCCSECSAPLPESGCCKDHFHAILLLERGILTPGAEGEVAHFHAVSSYVLQHPESMGCTAEALAGARRLLADHLAGGLTMAAVRQRVRHETEGSKRVQRRDGDLTPRWPVTAWTMTVADVLAGGAGGYYERVEAWARSVIDTLASAGV